jgi:hypothetical protein
MVVNKSLKTALVCILSLFSLTNKEHFKAIADAKVDFPFPLPTIKNSSLNLLILVTFS